MNRIKIISVSMALIILFGVALSGCGGSDTGSNQASGSSATEKQKESGSEVGKWYAEYKVGDINESEMAEEDRMLLSMLAGNIMFEMNAEFCDDGTFTYTVNIDEVKKSISDSVSKITSFFIDIDLSMFTDRLIEAVFDDVLESTQSEYVGEYTTSGDGLIIAKDEGLLKGSEPSVLYFKVISKKLVQVDEHGEQVFVFRRADSN